MMLSRSRHWRVLARINDQWACHILCRRACHTHCRQACPSLCRQAGHLHCRRACFGRERRQIRESRGWRHHHRCGRWNRHHRGRRQAEDPRTSLAGNQSQPPHLRCWSSLLSRCCTGEPGTRNEETRNFFQT